MSLELPLHGPAATAKAVAATAKTAAAVGGAAAPTLVAYVDKVSTRHANSHAIVNAGFVLSTDADGTVLAGEAVSYAQDPVGCPRVASNSF